MSLSSGMVKLKTYVPSLNKYDMIPLVHRVSFHSLQVLVGRVQSLVSYTTKFRKNEALTNILPLGTSFIGTAPISNLETVMGSKVSSNMLDSNNNFSEFRPNHYDDV